MALKVTLVRGLAGHKQKHRETVRGLGLTRTGMTRILQDTPAVRGMIAQVGYLLEWSETDEEFKPFGRRSRQARRNDAS